MEVKNLTPSTPRMNLNARDIRNIVILSKFFAMKITEKEAMEQLECLQKTQKKRDKYVKALIRELKFIDDQIKQGKLNEKANLQG